jgi:hypothetical protein
MRQVDLYCVVKHPDAGPDIEFPEEAYESKEAAEAVARLHNKMFGRVVALVDLMPWVETEHFRNWGTAS